MMRPTPLARQVEDLRSDLELLRSAQDRLFNVARLQTALVHYGLEVLGYEGPARYGLSRIVQCELCGELLDVTDIGYELRLRSKAWGPQYRYIHKKCFERATNFAGEI